MPVRSACVCNGAGTLASSGSVGVTSCHAEARSRSAAVYEGGAVRGRGSGDGGLLGVPPVHPPDAVDLVDLDVLDKPPCLPGGHAPP